MARIDRQALVVLGGIGRAFDVWPAAASSERQLLDRFLDRRDEAAFAALVARHGPMVLGTCRALLGDRADAEDAFQATFLVLARRAGSVRPGEPLGPWLHGVARRVALRAGADAARRRRREAPADTLDPAAPDRPPLDAERRELAALLHAELGRLAPPERSAVTLCDLEGLTHQEAADQLGWPLGTVKSRVARGRDRLRSRLSRRGVALAGPALAAALGAEAAAAPVVAAGLVAGTARAALAVAGGHAAAAGLATIPAYTLSRGVARAMIATKLKLLTLGLAATTGVVAVPAVVATRRIPAASPAHPPGVELATTAAADDGAASASSPDRPPPHPLDAAILARLEGPAPALKVPYPATFRQCLAALHLGNPDPEHGLPDGIPVLIARNALMLDVQAMNTSWNNPPRTLRATLGRLADQLLLEYRVQGGRLVFDVPPQATLPDSLKRHLDPDAIPLDAGPADMGLEELQPLPSPPTADGTAPAEDGSGGMLANLPEIRLPDPESEASTGSARAEAAAVEARDLAHADEMTDAEAAIDRAILAKLERPFRLPKLATPISFCDFIRELRLDAPDPEHGFPDGIRVDIESAAGTNVRDVGPVDVATLPRRSSLRDLLTRAASMCGMEYAVSGGRLGFTPIPESVELEVEALDPGAAQAPPASVPSPAARPAVPRLRPGVGPALLPAAAPRRPAAARPAPAPAADAPPDRTTEGPPAVVNPEAADVAVQEGLIVDAPATVIESPPLQPQPSPREAEDAKRNEAILVRLDQPVPLNFPSKVSLNTLVEYVKKNTAKPGEKPIPIFIDQRIFGEDAPGANGGFSSFVAKDGNEPLIVVDLEDVPLRTSLRLALRPASLDYAVTDGVLIISNLGFIRQLTAPAGGLGAAGGGMGVGFGGGMGGFGMGVGGVGGVGGRNGGPAGAPTATGGGFR